MRAPLFIGLASLALCNCAAGPSGLRNSANRAMGGAAAGAVLGGLAGAALGGDIVSGAVIGAGAGGALGAAVPDRTFHKDTRGDCYYVDPQGNRVYTERTDC